MTTPEEAGAGRGRRRSYHACLTCRRKKTRCPGEKPACSSCVRLKQSCSYPPVLRAPRSGRSEERLAHLEEKLDRLLNSRPEQSGRQDQQGDDATAISDKSASVSPPAPDVSSQITKPPATMLSPDNANARPGPTDIAVGMRLYFEYCHRQPIWCFDRDEVGDYGALPEELTCSILALTARFSQMREKMQLYGSNARKLIMLRIADSTVDITTIESLCLLAYSSFIDGNVNLGQFHLGLAFQLCRAAMLDDESAYVLEDPGVERKKRLFWSLQVLEQYYGRQTGLLSIPTEILRPSYFGTRDSRRPRTDDATKAPPLPRDDLGHSNSIPNEPGVWNTSVHLGWVWSRLRKYVSDCAHNIFEEPWRRDSMYASVLSDFMETENRIPMCHRYDTVKFYERKIEELKANRDYWTTWLKEQFTYHAIHSVLNHPFLYIVGSQHNPNLAIPNTFWRRSSELALIHSTWIVRLIDMVLDKQVQLIDPFFGHIAAIAATVHLYYCCAAAAKLKHKSNTDFAKCRRFLKSFIPFSPACAALDRNLDMMARIAAGSENVDVEDWMPSRIYLSVPLMWDILQFNCVSGQPEVATPSLLIAPHGPPNILEYTDEDSLLEIIVATSPDIIINTADGGQEAPTLPFKASSSAGTSSDRGPMTAEIAAAQADAITFNTTPWLYEDASQFPNIVEMGMPDSQSEMGEDTGMVWWEGDFSNAMLNQF